ncbi:MAG: hypothetical protein IBJ15_02120 [Alphaproteobacteria bacterium]|nr:hypothetical protein [Alphaproteobacteria bacterium]
MTNATRTISHFAGVEARSRDVSDLASFAHDVARREDKRTDSYRLGPKIDKALKDAREVSGIAAIQHALARDDGTRYPIDDVVEKIADWRLRVQAIIDGLPTEAVKKAIAEADKKARTAARQRKHKLANPVRRLDVRIPTADRLRRFTEGEGLTISDAIDSLLDSRGVP